MSPDIATCSPGGASLPLIEKDCVLFIAHTVGVKHWVKLLTYLTSFNSLNNTV